MTQQHPITPPPELVQQWAHLPADWNTVAPLIAQWGADQELEACCEWLDRNCPSVGAHHLRTERRPKPPSLKEQALEALGPEPLPETGPTGDTILNKSSIERHRHIRRALEALPDD